MFRELFKYYKSKSPLVSHDDVVSFYGNDDRIQRRKDIVNKESNGDVFGLIPPQSWEIYELINHPGLIFIKNPFTTLGQRHWIVRCLQDYTKKPNKNNLDPFNLIPSNQNWWTIAQENVKLREKLRWVTLGYHHDWDSKIYTETSRNDFPAELSSLSKFICKCLGFEDFNAEAAIINFYPMNSTLSGHTDHSEEFLEAPLLSFSFGQSAIFLLGGKSKEEPATPMFLHSGDIIIMSKESRLCYHGVPRILHAPSNLWGHNGLENSEFSTVYKNGFCWEPFGSYVKDCRININVRQVLRKGHTALNQK